MKTSSGSASFPTANGSRPLSAATRAAFEGPPDGRRPTSWRRACARRWSGGRPGERLKSDPDGQVAVVPPLGPNSRAVLGNTIFQGAGKTITALIGIAMVAILTRYLGPAGFGIYALAFAYLSFFQTFSDLGL